MRNRIRLAAAALLVVMLSLGTLAVVVAPSTPRPEGAGDADNLATGLEREAPGEEGEGKPVPLDPNGPTKVSAPQKIRGVSGSFNGDIRTLPSNRPRDRVERPEPGQPVAGASAPTTTTTAGTSPVTALAAPAPSLSVPGLNYLQNGNGFPPDTVGDVGPTHFVQAVNTSVGFFRKSDGRLIQSLSFDDFMDIPASPECDTANYGDPTVLYDTFEGRWIVSDFAFTMDTSGNLTSDSYQCFAVSNNSNPVTGGWNFYAFSVASGGDMADYPKMGVWSDGIYMSANVFGPSSFKYAQVWAFNKADFYSGAASPRAVTFTLPQSSGGTTVFSLLPSNAKSATGAPPAGRPNLFASIYGSYQVRVWKFSPNWNGTATFSSAPDDVSSGSFSAYSKSVPSPANSLDSLSYRLMMQNQYSNIGGVESLWLTHTVSQNNIAAVRWYQVPVTGGTVSAPRQAATWQPDTTVHRFMPSLAVDKFGNLALGYSVSSRGVYPGIRYAGQLAGDPVNTFSQGETVLANGGGSQTYSSRWGDYAAMNLDPDGCTFWFTTEIYDGTGYDWHTRISSFAYPSCVSPPASVPSTPASLSATAVSRSRINLVWGNSTGEDGYKIERSTNQTSWTLIATVAADSTTYASTGLARNTVYYYRVSAYNALGSSGYATANARTFN